MAKLVSALHKKLLSGSVSVSYSDTGNQSTVYRKLNMILAPYLASGGYGSSNFTVSHG